MIIVIMDSLILSHKRLLVNLWMIINTLNISNFWNKETLRLKSLNIKIILKKS